MAAEGEVVVVAGGRTPFGKFGGALRKLSNPRLAAFLIDALLARGPVQAAQVDEVILGTAVMGASTLSPARQAVLRSSLPDSVPSLNVDRACCSGLSALLLAARGILLAETEVALAGGVENMSETPLLLRDVRWGHKLGDMVVEDFLALRSPFTGGAIAKYVGEVALSYGVGRREQDAWAFGSHRRYAAALEAGKLADELVPVDVTGEQGERIQLAFDECPRPDVNLEAMARLPTVYDSPTVTAGNAPPLADGAAILVLARRARAEAEGWPVLATLKGWLSTSGPHTSSAYLPGEAIVRLARGHGITLADIARFEINEAFAATALVSTQVMAEASGEPAERLRERTNVNGGAVALGHPLGATGGRLVLTLIHELRRLGGGLGCVAICGGYGQTDALLLEV